MGSLGDPEARLTGVRLTRRRFLAAGAAGVLGTVSVGWRRGPRARRRVVVVGAGLAGLTAAYALRQSGFDVVVLEARDRVGGRVWTIRQPFVAGQHAEAGGEFVDTKHTSLLGYLRHFGLSTEDVEAQTPPLRGVTFLRGRRRLDSEVFGGRVRTEANRFWDRLEAIAGGVSLAHPTRAASLDRRSVGWLVDQLRLSDRARRAIEFAIRDDYAREPDDISLLYAALSTKVAENQPDAGIEAYRIRGGSDRLAHALASALGDSVALSMPVAGVARTSDGVSITAGGLSFAGDYCVLATPLHPLRRVQFTPALPATLRRAIAQMQYGVASKTMLQYSRRIWRERGFDGDVESDLRFNTAWEATDGQPGRPGILLAFTAGRNGALFSRLSAARRLAEVASELERVFPGSERLLGARFTVDWASDPYAGGTYTAFAPGQVTRFLPALRQPVGRIHLAGEHTELLSGYMESAIRSGLRAAADIRGRA